MASQQLQPRALYEAIADRVRDRILCHELKPGEPINEVSLFNDYGVSRTPVREALKVLHHEGLLTANARRGMVVTELDESELDEAMELHRLLRAHAGRRASSQAEPPRYRLLDRMLEMAERQLRLAYGPAFDEKMGREAVASSAAPASCLAFVTSPSGGRSTRAAVPCFDQPEAEGAFFRRSKS